MPELKILAACERVIIDLHSRLPSLIGILQRMDVSVPGAPMPGNAVAPLNWAVFTLWDHDASEAGREYVQRTMVTLPSGNTFFSTATPFQTPLHDDHQSRNTVELVGLPVAEEGYVTVTVWLDGSIQSPTHYRIAIRHVGRELSDRA